MPHIDTPSAREIEDVILYTARKTNESSGEAFHNLSPRYRTAGEKAGIALLIVAVLVAAGALIAIQVRAELDHPAASYVGKCDSLDMGCARVEKNDGL